MGGNMGDRMANLSAAKEWIEKFIGPIEASSSIYETAAWGQTNQPPFFNQAILINTPLDAAQTMQYLLEIESKMGRIRATPMGPRTIDLDIIYFNQETISTNLITIPHPRLAARNFVLIPINEIAPDYIHPILNKTNAALLKECGDSLPVYKKTDF